MSTQVRRVELTEHQEPSERLCGVVLLDCRQLDGSRIIVVQTDATEDLSIPFVTTEVFYNGSRCKIPTTDEVEKTK